MRQMTKSKARMIRTTAGTPTPIPALAPLLNPEDDACGVGPGRAVDDDEPLAAVVLPSVAVDVPADDCVDEEVLPVDDDADDSVDDGVDVDVDDDVDDEVLVGKSAGPNVVEVPAILVTQNSSPPSATSLFPYSVNLRLHFVGNCVKPKFTSFRGPIL
jgi:hypothetical protein